MKIRNLIEPKAFAEKNDDYDKLIGLKDGIVYLRDKGRLLKKYQQMKKLAVENEDYEVAKKVKNQINMETFQIESNFGVDTRTGKMYTKSN